jgi:hypothetical protein
MNPDNISTDACCQGRLAPSKRRNVGARCRGGKKGKCKCCANRPPPYARGIAIMTESSEKAPASQRLSRPAKALRLTVCATAFGRARLAGLRRRTATSGHTSTAPCARAQGVRDGGTNKLEIRRRNRPGFWSVISPNAPGQRTRAVP